ncbi:ribosome assembly cofactor RimP [Flavobacterium sp.]|jgi:ribosome maturation factor RimP|uniref:ribosome assembly cofactor RimP n=1 Tax=Flavobacterium sp. TaxID=239 RepID=UPI002A7EDC75|nr:ribosome assembly cofactor RimP [Flavobacterium sp.]
MTFTDKVSELVNEVFDSREDLFLIDLKIDSSNKIIITLDGDNGVNLQDCIEVSKAIDDKLDREEEDFSLEVASAGVSSPLKLVRQFKKNLNRTLKVKKTNDEVIEAQLTAASDENITLEWKAREQKKIGKGKETVEKKVQLLYSEIKEATVIISF